MTNSELNQIIETIKLSAKEKMIDDAFQYFIDNQINVKELDYILKEINYNLPSDFFDLNIDKQKRYHLHKERIVKFTDKGVVTIENEIFNKVYFYELVEASKKNKSATQALIDYVRKLDNLPLYFLAMKYIKLKNLNYAVYHDWLKYGINNLYDFYMYVINLSNKDFEKGKLIEQLITFFKKDTLFNLDLNLPFVKFAFDVETILSKLNDKVSNTIRMKFLVYKPEYLSDSEYNNMDNPRTLINKHKNSFSYTKLKELNKYYQSNNKKILDSFNDNGYRAIYYSILEEVEFNEESIK